MDEDQGEDASGTVAVIEVSMYRMLAEKLVQHMRRKMMAKMKGYRIFVRTAKQSMEEAPIVMTGSKIVKEENTPSLERSGGNRKESMTKSALPLKHRFSTTHSDHLIKSTHLSTPK